MMMLLRMKMVMVRLLLTSMQVIMPAIGDAENHIALMMVVKLMAMRKRSQGRCRCTRRWAGSAMQTVLCCRLLTMGQRSQHAGLGFQPHRSKLAAQHRRRGESRSKRCRTAGLADSTQDESKADCSSEQLLRLVR